MIGCLWSVKQTPSIKLLAGSHSTCRLEYNIGAISALAPSWRVWSKWTRQWSSKHQLRQQSASHRRLPMLFQKHRAHWEGRKEVLKTQQRHTPAQPTNETQSIEEKTERMNGSYFKVPQMSIFGRGPILSFQETWEQICPYLQFWMCLSDYTWYSQHSHKAISGMHLA